MVQLSEIMHSLSLRKTTEVDLDYVLQAEHDDNNRQYIIPWSREKHLQAIADADIAHLIVQKQTKIGYVILAGLLNQNRSIEFRRIVITQKRQGYGKETLEMIKELVFETHKAHRLWLDVKEQNYVAQAVYKAAGFVVEGKLRECLKSDNGYDSLIIMSILRAEYKKVR